MAMDDGWSPVLKKKRQRSSATLKHSNSSEELLDVKKSLEIGPRQPISEFINTQIDSYIQEPKSGLNLKISEQPISKKAYSGLDQFYKPKIENVKVSSTNPDNAKSTCRFDYAKDLCKDYNESGYCVFGDTCIFLHDRGDYKSGWQLELEWNEKLKSKYEKEKKPSDDDFKADKEDSVCLVCSREHISPVLAECGHKFCETCALTAYADSKRCPICKRPWNGSFQVVAK